MPDPKKMKNLDDKRKFSNAIREVHSKKASELAEQLLQEKITLSQWQEKMKELIREAHKQQFITGKGGNSKDVLNGDYGILGNICKKEYEYLDKFAKDIQKAQQEGRSLNFIKNRSSMYMRTAQSSFWVSAVPVRIPQVPRDGRTKCKNNCKCYLDIEENENDVEVYWRLKPAEHCNDCKTLNREWDPLVLPKQAKSSLSIEERINQGLVLFIHFYSREAGFDKSILEFLEVA